MITDNEKRAIDQRAKDLGATAARVAFDLLVIIILSSFIAIWIKFFWLGWIFN